MHYQISRNGQMYGPYTLDDLRRYLASGNVLPTDMAKSEEMPDWVPVSQLLELAPSTDQPVAAGFSTPAIGDSGFAAPDYDPPTGTPVYGQPLTPAYQAQGTPYQDPPNLHWGLLLLLGFLTCSLFMWVWNLIIAAWLKRVQPNATSLYYYLGAVVLFFVQMVVVIPMRMHHNFGSGMYAGYNPISSLVGLCVWIVRLIARFSQRASLEEHYNGPEPLGLRLDPVMTFFFGGIYFQSQLNRINAMKQAARFGAGRGF